MVNVVVEVCPYCESENTYLNLDPVECGYTALCKVCGERIMLCSECLRAYDNVNGVCDLGEYTKWETYSTACFRDRNIEPVYHYCRYINI